MQDRSAYLNRIQEAATRQKEEVKAARKAARTITTRELFEPQGLPTLVKALAGFEPSDVREGGEVGMFQEYANIILAWCGAFKPGMQPETILSRVRSKLKSTADLSLLQEDGWEQAIQDPSEQINGEGSSSVSSFDFK